MHSPLQMKIIFKICCYHFCYLLKNVFFNFREIYQWVFIWLKFHSHKAGRIFRSYPVHLWLLRNRHGKTNAVHKHLSVLHPTTMNLKIELNRQVVYFPLQKHHQGRHFQSLPFYSVSLLNKSENQTSSSQEYHYQYQIIKQHKKGIKGRNIVIIGN